MSTLLSSNYAFNLVGPLLPLVSALVTVPFYLDTIGAARYGVVAIIWVFLDYFSFLDFGLSQASLNALGKLSHASSETRAPVFVTALYMAVVFGLVGSFMFYFAGALTLQYAFPLPKELRHELLAAFPWVVPMLPAGMLVGVATGALESRERFLLSNLLKALGLMAGQVIPLLCVLQWGRSLCVLIPALSVVQWVLALAMFAVAVSLERPFRLVAPDLVSAAGMFRYGAWVSFCNLIRPLMQTADQMFVAQMLGPTAVAYYAVPSKLASRSEMLARAANRTLFPRLSRESVATGQRLTTDATMALIYISGAMCGPAIILAGPFLEIWLGRQFSDSSRLVAEILLLAAWTNGLASLPNGQIWAQGRPHITARMRAIEIIPFLLGLWLLTRAAGLPGAALAWLLRVAADWVALLWLSGSMRRALLRALPGVTLMIFCFLLTWGLVPSPGVALGLGTISGMLFLGIGVIVEPGVRKAVQEVVVRLIRTPRTEIAK